MFDLAFVSLLYQAGILTGPHFFFFKSRKGTVVRILTTELLESRPLLNVLCLSHTLSPLGYSLARIDCLFSAQMETFSGTN